MRALGFRCWKDRLAWVVLEGDIGNPAIVEHAHVSMPQGDRADQLVWLRSEVIEILQRTQPDAVGFKGAEGLASADLGRAESEGVMQEAATSAGKKPLKRLKTQIKKDIGFERSAKYLTKAPGDLGNLQANRQEAALAALSLLHRG